MTRNSADAGAVRRLMATAGRRIGSPTTIYLVGGATAVLHGWRPTTDDVDMKVVSSNEDAATRVLAALRDELGLNIEFASPDQFIPVLAGWPDRSPFVERVADTTYRHFEYLAQALAKTSRQVAHDRADVLAMVDRSLVSGADVWAYFRAVEGQLHRYPQVRGAQLAQKISDLLGPEPKQGAAPGTPNPATGTIDPPPPPIPDPPPRRPRSTA